MFAAVPLRVEFTARGRVVLLEPLAWNEAGAADVVPAGFISDGVTVPPLAWPLVGHPYSGSLLRAALLHDWQLSVRAEPARAIHDRFYRALRTSGVGAVRARLMWAAVRAFGPRF